MKFVVIRDREYLEIAMGADKRIVRWHPSFITTPFVDTGKGEHVSRAPQDVHHRYRGTCIEQGSLHAIWQPIAA